MEQSFIANHEHNAVLVLSDGRCFLGVGIGKQGLTTGEICFNTSMTGYQEVITDPSYAMQIITFTFPHIGNVGCNNNDEEANKIFCRGVVVAEKITSASNYRATLSFSDWLVKNNITGICNIDTRELTRHIRKYGANGALIHYAKLGEKIDLNDLQQQAKNVSNLDGVELSKIVTTDKSYTHDTSIFDFKQNCYLSTKINECERLKVVVIDYGSKKSLLNCLVASGCDVTVVSAEESFDKIKALNPDGVFLSNGPGDPYAAYEVIKDVLDNLINSGIPMFGVCMGHQLLAIAFQLKTIKMHQGHRGSNHPVKNLQRGQVEITSQNHGFCVELDENKLPSNIEITHISLFDRTIEGIALLDRPIFSVQYHPESSPGPIDSRYLFDKFVASMKLYKNMSRELETTNAR